MTQAFIEILLTVLGGAGGIRSTWKICLIADRLAKGAQKREDPAMLICHVLLLWVFAILFILSFDRLLA